MPGAVPGHQPRPLCAWQVGARPVPRPEQHCVLREAAAAAAAFAFASAAARTLSVLAGRRALPEPQHPALLRPVGVRAVPGRERERVLRARAIAATAPPVTIAAAAVAVAVAAASGAGAAVRRRYGHLPAKGLVQVQGALGDAAVPL